MAVLWKTTRSGKHYEVRSAGKSVRLYTDGIFHSQWHSQKPISGHLWDLLSLPGFFSGAPETILMLGVGGGAAINTLQALFQPQAITGIDLDDTHLQIAKKFFKCSAKNIQLIHQDAKIFMDTASSKHEHYDYIVEDLFCGTSTDKSDARRAFAADKTWLTHLASTLTSKGTLIVNFENEQQLQRCVNAITKTKLGFKTLYCLQSPRYENAIGVFIKNETNLGDFTKRLEHYCATTGTVRSAKARAAKIIEQLIIKRL